MQKIQSKPSGSSRLLIAALCLCLVLLCIEPVQGTLSYVVGVSSSVINTFEGESQQEETPATPDQSEEEEDIPDQDEPVIDEETPADDETLIPGETTEDTETLTPTDGSTPTESEGGKTGDASNALRYILGIIAAAAALALIWTRQPNDKSEGERG